MPARKQQPHTEAWDAIKQMCLWPEQKAYELLRPVVLFGDPPSERAHETKANERTLRRQADRFDAEGMVSLFRPMQHETTDEHRSLPPPIRQALVDLRDASFLWEEDEVKWLQVLRLPEYAALAPPGR